MFREWFARLARNGLRGRVETIDGGYVPRVNRGSKLPAQLDQASNEQFLSRHAYGAALDLNALTNQRCTEGAQLGQKGCVRELVLPRGSRALGRSSSLSSSRSDPIKLIRSTLRAIGAPAN